MIAHVTDRLRTAASPAPGTAAWFYTYDLATDKPWLMSVEAIESRSDTIDASYLRISHDNGRTWGPREYWPTRFDDPHGTGRRHFRGVYLDRPTNRAIRLWTQGVLPNDKPLEGMVRWAVHYAVSSPGSAPPAICEQIVCDGPEFSAAHPLPGVTLGANCYMMGDLGERPLTRSDGVILVPLQSSPVGPDGTYHNPGKGFTYTDAVVVHGRWRPDGGLAWTASQRVVGDPARTTRGLVEPTLGELEDGTLIMVMRGSNDAQPALPAWRWISRSADGGITWTAAEPWTYDDGEPFHSPSSCSQLIPHRSGRLLWVGNICKDNARGNGPRYPLILTEVDRRTGLLIRRSVSILDDRREGESPALTLSNFLVRQEYGSDDLLLHLTRLFAQDYRAPGKKADFTADAWMYRIELRA